MPNWCQGVLKIRGDVEAINKFMHEGLEVCKRDEDGNLFNEPPRYGACGDISNVVHDWHVHVIGTRRGFVDEVLTYYDGENSKEVALSYKQAWRIEAEELREIAKKFKLGMRIQGFECGMEFVQDVEADDAGNVIHDDVFSYDDYFWQCPCPTLGG